jgi:acyl carrier protein
VLQDADHYANDQWKFGMKDIATRVQALVAAHFGIEQARVTPQAALVADLGANSLDVVEITMGLEQEFDLAISDAVAEEFQTIGDIEAFLQRNSNAK